ncbi:hypothetical protein Tco_1180779 [Tanacetum coccineum]
MNMFTPPTTKAQCFQGSNKRKIITQNTLKQLKPLSKVASLKSRSIDKGMEVQEKKRYKSEEISKEDKGTNFTRRSSAYCRSDEDCIPLQKEEGAEQIHLECSSSTKDCRKEDLTEQQKKRKAQSLQRALLEVNFKENDFAKKNVDILKTIHSELLKESMVMEVTSADEVELLMKSKRLSNNDSIKRLKEEKGEEAKDEKQPRSLESEESRWQEKGMITRVGENDS